MDGVSFIDGKHSDEDVLQVSLVCPDVSVDDIRTDLLITNSAELTVNRILDGTFYRSDFVSAQDNGVDRPTGTVGGGQRSPSEADCSTTDVNSDSDTDSPCKSSEVPAVDKNTGCSGTDVNSDDDLVIVSSKVSAKTLPPRLQSCTTSAMYGSHCISDDSGVSDNDLPNAAHSNPPSVCSDDELTSKERQPLSELLGLNSVKGCNSSNVRAPTNYLPLALDEEAELPDLEAYTDSFHTDSVDIATTDWSQNTADTALSSQTSTISASSASSGAYNSKKKRRTPEEIAESKKLALERKAQKERDKKEREERKKREVHARKAVQEAKKQTRPGDCMKYITVVVDLGLINAGSGAAVLAAFDGEPVKCVAETQPVPNTISWRRLVVDHRVAEDASLQTVETEQLESEVLLIFSTTDFLQLADNTKQFQSGCVSEDLTLTAHTQRVQQVYGGRNVTVIALGMEQYFRERKTDLQRKHRNAVRGDGAEQPSKKRSKTQASAAPILSRLEIEEVLVGLQLQTGCNCQLVETSKDLVELVKTFTKAVAEAPSKKGRLESAFSFHCEGGGVGKVDKGGAGLLKVWKQQLQQFKTISAEMANAIIAAYPSPRMLVEAYKRCSNEREAERLLEDIVVRRGAGALTTNRRIGKELSRRVFQLFTVTDPDFVLT